MRLSSSRFRSPSVALLCVVFLCLFGPPLLGNRQIATTIIPEGVTDFSLSSPKIFWLDVASCIETPDHGPVLGAGDPHFVARIPTHGGESRRLFFFNPPRPERVCNPYRFHSEIESDDDYVYWVSSEGLVRLSTEANPGDPTELLSANVTGNENLSKIELADDANFVFALVNNANQTATLWRVRKSDGSSTVLRNIPSRAKELSADQDYIYWIEGGRLQRLSRTRRPVLTTLATNVTGYHAEGRRYFLIVGGGSDYLSYVFYGRGNQVFRYNNRNATVSNAIYTSDDPDGRIYSLTTDSGRLFFFERRPTNPGGLFTFYQQILVRTSRFGTGRAGTDSGILYCRFSELPGTVDAIHLTADGDFLFWQEDGRLRRKSKDADTLPETNLRVTGLEVTQGIQDLDNSVFLVQNRRTFVRLYVESEDAAVPGVTAALYRVSSSGSVIDGPLAPSNLSGTHITVQTTPDRANLDDSFLFQLPWAWTEGNLRLRAELNPYKVPLEPSYSDNLTTEGPFEFEPSPLFRVRFFAFGYETDGTTHTPRYKEDYLQTLSWLRRVYPLASGYVPWGDSTSGLSTQLWNVFDENLGSRVDQSHPVCDTSLCASRYVRAVMAAWRTEWGAAYPFYGLISTSGGWPRGSANAGMGVGTSPAGPMCCNASWDTDGAITDWYTGHELGHILGRGHPTASASSCDNSSSDNNYPYADGLIGNNNTTFAGFDVGDVYFHKDNGDPLLPRMVLPQSQWSDLMTYCPRQWISDYTYRALYNKMMDSGSGAGAGAGGAAGGPQEDDWLMVFGNISASGDSAVLQYVRRVASVASIPELIPGQYSILLVDERGNTLASYPFSPETSGEDPDEGSMFGQVVPFMEDTAEILIVHGRQESLLAQYAVSANQPVVDNVTLGNAQSPLSGTVTLGWTASDPDGDELLVDILYLPRSRRGANFLPLRTNVSGNSVEVDTERLGGGGAIFRVVVSDGVHSTHADSARFIVASKPPVPRILAPADDAVSQYGQLINFMGEADDLGDGGVGGRNLVWRRGGAALGRGPLLSVTDMPVGDHEISLTATNSEGLSATTSITITVHDNLTLPGPTLTAGPLQVGWQVPVGTSEQQSTQISISNSGSGVLSWTASENASWLRLVETSGQAPSALVAVADPSGLENETVTTHIVIHRVGDSQQTISIPVSLTVGSWIEEPASGETQFVRGDINDDGVVNISDASSLLNWLFTGGPGPSCLDAADTNDDAVPNVSDASYLLNFLFVGGPALPAPFPHCDTAPDGVVDCQNSAACD